MKVSFTKEQKEMLYGHAPEIALRCGCSKQYVYKVLSGARNVKTDLSKSVMKSARDIIRFKEKFVKAS